MRKLVIFLVIVALMLGIGGCSLVQPSVTTTVPSTTTQTPTNTTQTPTTTTTQVSTTSGWEIVRIVLTTDGFDMALEPFYSDEENTYQFPAVMSPYMVVHYSNGTEEKIRDAISAGRVTLADLDRFGIQYYTTPKTN